MIDYIKILLLQIDKKRLSHHPLLDFKTVVSTSTGVVSSKEVATYHFCKITVYNSGLVLFSGSIHKMYNSLKGIKAPNYTDKKKKKYKGYNGNQFTINQVLEIKEHLNKLFQCTSTQMLFLNIEFGINTLPIFCPQLFIKGLLYHKGKMFEYQHNQHFAQCVHQQFIIKIYNKSNQYKISVHTLRIEVKYLKMQEVCKMGIKTFADINTSTLNNAKKILLKRFDEVVYYDYTINKKRLRKLQKRSLKNYSNPRYWFEDITVNNRFKHKKKLKNLIVKYATNLHQQLRQEITQRGSINNRLFKKAKGSINTHSNIGVILPPLTTEISDVKKHKKCIITGVDISMQKESSFLLSINQIRNLYHTDKNKFDTIKNKYLSKKWMDADLEKQIFEMYHNIRNKYSNLRISKSLKHNPKQTYIFDSVI